MQNDKQKQQEGAGSEDPPVNNTKQNAKGDQQKKDTVDVPKQAVENYKESGNEGEE